MENKPTVSVCMITYNHEAFIAEAIEGVLMQEAHFRYELVIGEDYSTDGTRKICEDYAAKYPDKIKLLPSEKNHGMMPNFIRTYQACDGKYIALCEGDDYWTDAQKLQIQVDYIERHNDCSIIGHGTHVLKHGKFLLRKLGPAKYLLEDLIHSTKIGSATCSIMFRNSTSINEKINSKAFKNSAGGDWLIIVICLYEGYLYVMEEIMGVYRIHEGGAYSTKGKFKQFSIHFSTALAVSKLTNHKHLPSILWYNFKRLVKLILGRK